MNRPELPVADDTGAPRPRRTRRRSETSNSAELALRAVVLVAHRGTITVSQLARELDIASSTAHRILTNCRKVGFVRQDNHGGPYLVGATMHEIALTVTGSRNLRESAGPVLAQLQEETGKAVAFYVLEGRHVRVVETIPGRPSKGAAPALGRLLPAHCTAGGKVLLSLTEPEDLRKRFPGGILARYTDRTITDWSALLDDLALVRQRGWAVSLGECDPSLTGIAAAVLLSTGRAVGAVVLTGHAATLRTRSEIDALVPLVAEAAHTVTARLRH